MVAPANPTVLATVAKDVSSGMEDYMARFKVSVKPNNSTARPHLKWVVNYRHPSEGRKRQYFPTKEKADGRADEVQTEIDNFGLQALQLTPAQRIQALDAIERLKPHGATITDAVVEYLERRSGSTKTMGEVCRAFIETRVQKKRSIRHLDGLRNVLNRFNEKFEEIRIRDITAEQVQDWINARGVGPRTMNHMRAVIHSVFAYALKKKIVRENVVKDVDKEDAKGGKVGILIPEEMRALLVAARGEPDVLATIAIGGFAGIRPEELKRLQKSAILIERDVIDCGSEITKTAQHRYVKIEPVLKAWLEPILSKLPLIGPIQGMNFRRRFDDVRKAAGFAVRGGEGKPWPHDALRHSFGSYHLAHFKNAAVTAIEMGHEGTSMLYSNYRARVGEDEAKAWWNLMPEVAK